jgi:lysylphosphatidylglycerol synthetase-like protein (DUF2156 family)
MSQVITWVSVAVFAVVLAALWAWSGFRRRHANYHHDRAWQREDEA